MTRHFLSFSVSLLLGFMLVLVMGSVGLATTWRVSPAGTDPGDCSGGGAWSTAFATIQKAIDCAETGDLITVKQGHYKIDDTIYVDKAVRIFGGYSGSGSDRDVQNNPTVIDGRNAMRCFHITDDPSLLKNRNEYDSDALNAVINGLFIIRGLAAEEGFSLGDGGGMYIESCCPKITNCTFGTNPWNRNPLGLGAVPPYAISRNVADNFGGAIYSDMSSPTISDCTFGWNEAYAGGAIYSTGQHQYPPVVWGIYKCTFVANKAKDESAFRQGGAVYNDSNCDIAGCRFILNKAKWGGAIFSHLSRARIRNCSFYANNVDEKGAGILVKSSLGNSAPTISNCILWGNVATSGKKEIFVSGPTLPTVTYSNVDQSGYDGTNGNIRLNPLFANWKLNLQTHSACGNRGSNTSAQGLATDFENDDRIIDGVVDMGADEILNPYTDPWILSIATANGDPDPGDVIELGGVNFSTSGGTVHIGPDDTLYYDEDYPYVQGDPYTSDQEITIWDDYRVRLHLPNFGCGWFGVGERTVRVWVTIDGEDSNERYLTIKKPSCP